MKACFMGLGYIGLPTAIIAAKHGIQITGVDINPSFAYTHIVPDGPTKDDNLSFGCVAK